MASHHLGDRLDAEWQALVEAPATAQALARWRRLEQPLQEIDDLPQLRRLVHDRTQLDRADRVLAALVRLAAVTGHDDLLATRVVLQLMAPGGMRLAKGLRNLTGDPVSAESLVFGELTIQIRTYPWRRRPKRVAANLLLDTRQRLLRAHHRTRAEVTVGLDPLAESGAADEQSGWLELDDLLQWAHRRGVLSWFEVQLLVASHVADIPINRLTKLFGRSRSTLFSIRASAEDRLRRALSDQPAMATANTRGDRR